MGVTKIEVNHVRARNWFFQLHFEDIINYRGACLVTLIYMFWPTAQIISPNNSIVSSIVLLSDALQPVFKLTFYSLKNRFN